MISLETAKSLKEAGMAWEPKFGDLFRWGGENQLVDKFDYRRARILSKREPGAVWFPRLDQLLAEIENRGYGYSLFFKAGRTGIPPYEMHIWAEGFPQEVFLATDCDKAVAKALLWILKEG